MSIPVVYLDACILNRLSDDQGQLRVRREAEAVEAILGMILTGAVEWTSSVALDREIRRNPDAEKRADALAVLAVAGALRGRSPQIVERAEFLHSAGYGAFDGLHLAYAELSRVDVLLTTDDRFIRQAARGLGKPKVRVLNPLVWLKEVRDGSR